MVIAELVCLPVVPITYEFLGLIQTGQLSSRFFTVDVSIRSGGMDGDMHRLL